ncbi:MAG: hypothetical protein ACP5NV_00495 [Candidatus Woesearchaeota archaeon]
MRDKYYRKGYFFILDAFIAATILVVSLVFIFNSDVAISQRSRDYSQAETVANFLLDTKLEDLDNQYVENLIINGTISNPRNTIVQQLDIFYYNANYLCIDDECRDKYTILSENLFKNITSPIVSNKYGYSYTIRESSNNLTVYADSIASYNSSNFRLVTKRISYSLINETTIFAPHIVELALWQK